MANPTSQWDKVPIFGWYMELDGSTPKVGQIKLTLGQRVNTQSSFHTTFPGGTVTATIGDTTRTDLVNQIRAAMSAVDQAAVEAAGGTFDAAAWGAVWDAKLPSAFFTDFPASDDPDIIGQGYEVKVEEKLTSGDGKIYYITPKLSDLLKPIPGVNLGEVDVPPGSPTAPAPIYQKGVPGGVAPLDDAGLVPTENLPASIAGAGSWTTLTDKPAVIAAGDTQLAARTAIGAGTSDLTVGTTATDAKPGDWKPTAADISDASTVGQSLVKATDAATARTVIGAGTSSVVLGTTAGTAADASTVVPVTRTVNAKPLTGDIALDAADVDARPVNWFPTTADISDATTVGKALVKAVDAVTARTAIGAGTSNLVLGTVAGTAADPTTVVPNTRKIANKPLSADVTLAKGDVGLGAVDNTADVDKPVSTAQSATFAAKTDIPTAATLDGATATGVASMTAPDKAGARAVLGFYELANGADPKAAGVPAQSWVFFRPVPSVVEPTRAGSNYVNGFPADTTSVQTATADTTMVVGSWAIIMFTGNEGAVGAATPAGFTVLMPLTLVGTLHMAVYGKIVDATDVNTNARKFTMSFTGSSQNCTTMLLWGGTSAQPVANWLIGTVENRATAGGTNVNIAPSITTTVASTLVLALSGERTSAADTAAPAVTGGNLWVWGGELQPQQLQTSTVAYIDKATAGATGNVTFTYQNPHTTNGLALQVGIPPVAS